MYQITYVRSVERLRQTHAVSTDWRLRVVGALARRRGRRHVDCLPRAVLFGAFSNFVARAHFRETQMRFRVAILVSVLTTVIIMLYHSKALVDVKLKGVFHLRSESFWVVAVAKRLQRLFLMRRSRLLLSINVVSLGGEHSLP